MIKSFYTSRGLKHGVYSFVALLSPLLLWAQWAELNQYPPLYYPLSTHWLAGASALGDSVELEDGSVWKICHYDRYKALNWQSDDPLTITQNHRWFSSHKYSLVNQNSGACLEANLFLGPFERGEYTLYITAIDWMTGQLVLTNGCMETTYWQICPADIGTFQNWALSDVLMIGQNSGWDSHYETLLINVNMDDFARARQN